jgi:hypothetical protein
MADVNDNGVGLRDSPVAINQVGEVDYWVADD